MGPLVQTGLSGLGAGFQQAGIDAQQRERRAILNRQLDKSAATQAKGADEVLTEAQSMSPTARLAAMKAAEDATFGRTQADLAGAGADQIDTAAGDGNQSQAFLTAKADRALSEGNRMAALARAAAKTRAVGQVQQNEGMRRSSLAEALGALYGTDQADSQAAQMEADSVGMPWYGQLGQVVNAAGQTYMRGPRVWSGR